MRLGPIAFHEFEVVAGVRFGGRQEIVTHRLGNGRRVIDVLGPEATDIRFGGMFSGIDALRRAKAIDEIRKAGQPVELSWGTLRYKVIISRFDASYEMQAWIPYQAICTVVQENTSVSVSKSSSRPVELANSMLSTAATLLGTIVSVGVLSPGLKISANVLTSEGQTLAGSCSLDQMQTETDAALAVCQSRFAASNLVLQKNSAGNVARALIELEQLCQIMCTIVSAQAYLASAKLNMDVM